MDFFVVDTALVVDGDDDHDDDDDDADDDAQHNIQLP